MYIEHSLMADYFYAGLALLVIASFVAGILIPLPAAQD